MSNSQSKLFEPVKLGELELPNRIVMASMSRARTNNPGLVPNDLQVEYYRQRSSAGLIMTEGTWPSSEAIGAPFAPGLYTRDQVEGWKRVTHAVHEAGGRIMVQLGHTGAASHPHLLGGNLPLAPSAVSVNIDIFVGEMLKSPVPKEMTRDDIERTIGDFAKATRLAEEAEFDGVELHGTVCFLIPEFLNERFNLREDEYGGGIENRARFPLEILRAMISEWRPGRIGFKVSPALTVGDLSPTSETLPTYEYLVKEVSKLKIAYMQFQNAAGDLKGSPVAVLANRTAQHFRGIYNGAIIANGGIDKTSGDKLIASGDAEAVSIGAYFLSNPDLVERLRNGIDLAPVPPRETWYGGGAEGYVDYPVAT